MNIALFPSAFHPSLGGVEELTRQLAQELCRRGHAVRIFTERWPRDLPAAETIEGLEVRRYPMRVPAGSMKSQVSFALTHRRIRTAIVDELRRFQPDVLHAQCVSSSTLYALHARQVLGVPLIVTLQGELTMDANEIFKRPGIAQTIMRRALTEADHVTACSAKTLRDGLEFIGHQSPVPTSVIFNGANIEEIRCAKPVCRAKPFILALGRLVPQKGFDVLLDAIPSSLPDGWELVLAGDGPLLSEIRERISRDDLRSRVDFLGRADRRKVASLLKGCEFVVVPSRANEGLPVVCAEAMAARKPIVGTAMGGIPEAVLDGETGLLAPADDVESLSAAVKRLCDDEPLRRRMGLAAASRASKFSWPQVTGEYEAVYESCSATPATISRCHDISA